MRHIGNKNIHSLAISLAKGWRDFLTPNQRSILAEEIEELVGSVIVRDNQRRTKQMLRDLASLNRDRRSNVGQEES